MDLRAQLERMREVQSAQMAALRDDDDARLDALLDEMQALVSGLPDDVLTGNADAEVSDLAESVRAAQVELMASAERRRAEAGGLLRALDNGRSALAAYSPHQEGFAAMTDHAV